MSQPLAVKCRILSLWHVHPMFVSNPCSLGKLLGKIWLRVLRTQCCTTDSPAGCSYKQKLQRVWLTPVPGGQDFERTDAPSWAGTRSSLSYLFGLIPHLLSNSAFFPPPVYFVARGRAIWELKKRFWAKWCSVVGKALCRFGIKMNFSGRGLLVLVFH